MHEYVFSFSLCCYCVFCNCVGSCFVCLLFLYTVQAFLLCVLSFLLCPLPIIMLFAILVLCVHGFLLIFPARISFLTSFYECPSLDPLISALHFINTFFSSVCIFRFRFSCDKNIHCAKAITGDLNQNYVYASGVLNWHTG